MEKVEKYCSNCDTKYSIKYNEEETELDPLTCPFCGYEVEDELETEDKEEDNWN